MTSKVYLIVAACALVAGCMSVPEPQGHTISSCSPAQPPVAAARCGAGKVPSAYFAVKDGLLYISAWKRQEEILAAFHAKVSGPRAAQILVAGKLFDVQLVPTNSSGATETEDGFLLPAGEVKRWDEKKPPQVGDVLFWLDHECQTSTYPLTCTRADYEAPAGVMRNGWLRWTNGQPEKSYGGCAPKPSRNCTSVWTDAGEVSAYSDSACQRLVISFREGLWACFQL